MIRKLIVSLASAGLLAGCVSDYAYRGGGGAGSYYYGRPSVDYGYYGQNYGYGYYPYGDAYRYRNYGYPGYYGGGYGYPGYYPSPYPRYYYPNYRPHRPPGQRPPQTSQPSRGIPWRDAHPVGGGAWAPNNSGAVSQPRSMPQPRAMQQQPMQPRMQSAPSTRRDGGRAWKDVER